MIDPTLLVEQMREQIEFYRNGELSLGVLIGNLESLHRAITSQSEPWKESVFEKIGDLEQVYAVMLDREMEELDAEGRMIVDKALGELVLLLTGTSE